MRRLQKFIASLYPPKWRARYGDEFNALLEQIEPRPGELMNLFTGAVGMHMTEWSYLRFAVVFGVAGLLGGLVIQVAVPAQYQSLGLIAIPSQQKWVVAKQRVFSRGILKTVIEDNNLYGNERLREPLEDVIEKMRGKDLKSKVTSSSEVTLAFTYPDGAAAQKTIQNLMSLVESDPEFRTLSGAGAPSRVSPNRLQLLSMYVGTALLLGLGTAGAVRMHRNTLRTLGRYGLIAGVLFSAGSLIIADQYTSSAVVMCADAKRLQAYQPTDEQIAMAISQEKLFGGNAGYVPMKDLVQRFRKQVKFTRGANPGEISLLYISASSNDAHEAQKLGQIAIAWVTGNAGAGSSRVEVTENASLPESPSSPNRAVLVGLAIGLGLIAGAFRVRFRMAHRLRAA